MKKKFRALGVISGVGSMLIGAKQAGFDIVGNIEWRPYYHTGTFEHNFKKAFLVKNIKDLPRKQIKDLKNIDLIMGHPECGGFSNLNIHKENLNKDPMDIPLFADLVKRIQPRFFVMDNLPGSLLIFKMKDWVKRFPNYDLYPEWISNYHYGNLQKHRKRFFMIGSLKSENFVFQPNEKENTTTVEDALGDIFNKYDGEVKNHYEHVTEADCGKALGLLEVNVRSTWEDLRDHFKGQKCGHNMMYFAKDGTIKGRYALIKTYWEKHCHVLTGDNPTVHPLTNLPFSIRERARLQGCPDDFEFIGEKIDSDNKWDHQLNKIFVKQTGKFMPVQFCNYVSKQIMAHIENKKFSCSGERFISPHIYIDESKKWYCDNIGYKNQRRVCDSCWLNCMCKNFPQ